MRALLQGMTHRQYFLLCEDEGAEPEDYWGQPFPHPYIDIWIECKRHANQFGVPLLPEPDKGILDQDADLMLAFEVLEAFQEQQQYEEEQRQKLKQTVRSMNMPFMPDA